MDYTEMQPKLGSLSAQFYLWNPSRISYTLFTCGYLNQIRNPFNQTGIKHLNGQGLWRKNTLYQFLLNSFCRDKTTVTEAL